MIKKTILSFLFLCSFLFSNEIGIKKALEEAKAKEKDLLLFIYSDHCYYCESMFENTLQDKEVKRYIDKRFVLLKVHQNDKKLLRDDIRTDFVPITYIISYEDEDILLELPGRKDKDTFLSIVKDTLLE